MNKHYPSSVIEKRSSSRLSSNNKYVLESLASDLKRVAIGKHRGSAQMAQRFLDEALKRKQEVDGKNVAPYIKNLLKRIDKDLDAEDALMYSTLIQNYTQSSLI